MSMVIAHNIPGINTQRQFNYSASGMSSSMEKLSSGYKINTGKDGAAALSISEKLRSQINGLSRAQQNTEEAMNVMSIAEGALNEMNSILKNLKALAIHSANTGVTSAEQIAADQAEADSAIQTIDRIASTTSFSNDKLLNGSKDIAFDQNTLVKGTQNNELLDARASSFSQIFKRDGYSVSINFTGTTRPDAVTSIGKADFSKQAMRAYLEVDTAKFDANGNPVDQQGDFDENGCFTHEQSFTIVGNQGSRSFTFSQGDSVANLVSSIKSVAGSTGINAALVFNSAQKINAMRSGAGFVASGGLRTAGAAVAYNNVQLQDTASGKILRKNIISGLALPMASGGKGVAFGKNTDGQGNIYVKFISETTYELYKDADMTKESLVATGISGKPSKAINNSGLNGVVINIASGIENIQGVRGVYIATAGIELKMGSGVKSGNGIKLNGSVVASGAASGAIFQASGSVINGVQLGINTSDEGKVYLKTVYSKTLSGAGSIQVFAYKDKQMREQDLVAKSDLIESGVANLKSITLNELRNRDNTAGTGLGMVLNVSSHQSGGIHMVSGVKSGSKMILTGDITFTNVGARIYAEDYGSQGYIKLTQDKGSIFSTYGTPDDFNSKRLIEAGANGTTFQVNGQDATLSINGMQVRTNGLELKMATQDIQADFTFKQGKVGSTTLAQVGYGDGSIFTGIGALTLGNVQEDEQGRSGLMCNAGHVTNSNIGNFQGGMQLQLGEGAGDQNRTIVGIKSMSINELGRITEVGSWDGSAVQTKKTFTLQDVMGGGLASFSTNPIRAMKIIDQSISDVTETRAKIGAMQSNLLQTNSNNLSVIIENVTKTESGIRDTDMAGEMAEFTKNQVLQSAAMSMMGQANQRSQSVLQLLQ